MTHPLWSRVVQLAVAASLAHACTSSHEGDEAREASGASTEPSDGGEPASAARDGVSRDAGMREVGSQDAAARDDGSRDAGVRDGGPRDARVHDDPRDAAPPDDGPRDAGMSPRSADSGPQPGATDAAIDSSRLQVGHGADAVDASWGAAALQANQWLVATVTIPPGDDVRVFELRAVIGGVPTPPDGRSIRLALWSEATDAQGRQPGTLVAYSSITGAHSGLNSQPVTDTRKPVLTAGTTYWLGINTTRPGTTLARRAGAGDEVTLRALATDVPGATLTSFPDVAPSYGTSDYGLSLLVEPVR